MALMFDSPTLQLSLLSVWLPSKQYMLDDMLDFKVTTLVHQALSGHTTRMTTAASSPKFT